MKRSCAFPLTSSPRLTSALMILSLTCAASSVQADFTTGFETSDGYTTGAPLVGQQDASAPAGHTWQTLFNSSVITVESAQGVGNSQAIKIADASSSTAYGAKLDLGTSVDFTKSFSFSFSVALQNMGGAGSVAQVYLGADTVSPGTMKYWCALTIAHDGNIYLYTDNANGTGAVAVSLGAYQRYVSAGSFLDISMTIDTDSKKFTSLTLAGQDKTSIVSSSVSGGTIPWLHATSTLPSSYLCLVAGGGSTGDIYFDNISIQNIPEPSAIALAIGLGGILLAGRKLIHKHNK